MKGKDLPRLGATQDGIVYLRHDPILMMNENRAYQNGGSSLTIGTHIPPPPPPPPPPPSGSSGSGSETHQLHHPVLLQHRSTDHWWSNDDDDIMHPPPLPEDHNTTNHSARASNNTTTNTTSSTTTTSAHKKTQYHKTKLCPWHRDGKCFMGAACNYAHSREELKPKPDLSKTKLCPEVVKNRKCDRPGCRFAHDFVELRATSTFFKTRICKFWQRGYCPAGKECRHAHGKEDLRQETTSTSSVIGTSEEDLDSIDIKGSDDSLLLYEQQLLPPPPPQEAEQIPPSPSFISTTAACTPLKSREAREMDNWAAATEGNETALWVLKTLVSRKDQNCSSEGFHWTTTEGGGGFSPSSDGTGSWWKVGGPQQTPLNGRLTVAPSTTAQSPATPSFDEKMFLPSSVLQSLSMAMSPVNHHHQQQQTQNYQTNKQMDGLYSKNQFGTGDKSSPFVQKDWDNLFQEIPFNFSPTMN